MKVVGEGGHRANQHGCGISGHYGDINAHLPTVPCGGHPTPHPPVPDTPPPRPSRKVPPHPSGDGQASDPSVRGPQTLLGQTSGPRGGKGLAGGEWVWLRPPTPSGLLTDSSPRDAQRMGSLKQSAETAPSGPPVPRFDSSSNSGPCKHSDWSTSAPLQDSK